MADDPNQNKQRFEGFETQALNVENVSDKQLKRGYWILTHKKQFQNLGTFSLMFFCVLTIGYSLISLGHYFIFQYEEYTNALNTAGIDYVNYPGLRAMNAIEPLEIVSRQVLTAGPGKIDIALRVRNPNVQWALEEVKYQFSIGSQVYDTQSAFVMPGEEKYLFALNVDGVASGTPQIFFEEEDWQRVTRYEEWGPKQTNFLITDKQFQSARQSELSSQLPISQAVANLTNATPFNYGEIVVQFALISANRLVGVNQITVRDLDSSEQRDIVARWSEPLSSVSTVEIIPTVNVLDERNYRDFEGQIIP